MIPYDRIRRKLKIEARQLLGCSDAVIILEVNGLHRGVFGATDDGLRRVVDEFAHHHTSTTGVAIVTRIEKHDGTHGIVGPYFALAETAMPTTFWDHMVAIDQGRTALSALDQLA